MTNHHVVDGYGERFIATTHSKARTQATLVGIDPLTDLAVVRLQDAPPDALSLRKSPALLGEFCLGLGSPFGMYPESVALGIVSGLARSIPTPTGRPIERAIQTDVAINPGNSGGPLVDVRGAVIGVNQCIDSRGAGLGFAIPADTAQDVFEEIVNHGKVERAALGVAVAPRPVEIDGQEVMRLMVLRTTEQQGLATGDVILRVADQDVSDQADLFKVLSRKHIGRVVPLVILRNGRPKTIELKAKRLER